MKAVTPLLIVGVERQADGVTTQADIAVSALVYIASTFETETFRHYRILCPGECNLYSRLRLIGPHRAAIISVLMTGWSGDTNMSCVTTSRAIRHT